jgi:hypothetical protein
MNSRAISKTAALVALVSKTAVLLLVAALCALGVYWLWGQVVPYPNRVYSDAAVVNLVEMEQGVVCLSFEGRSLLPVTGGHNRCLPFLAADADVVERLRSGDEVVATWLESGQTSGSLLGDRVGSVTRTSLRREQPPAASLV